MSGANIKRFVNATRRRHSAQPFRPCAIAVTLFLALQSGAIAGAAEKMTVKFIPKDSSVTSITKDQITFSAEVIDGSNYKEDANVWTHYKISGKNKTTIQFDDVVAQFPLFNVIVQNNSDQTLKLRSKGSGDEVIVAMDDDRGNTIYALKKEKMRDSARATYVNFTKSRVDDPTEAAAQLMETFEAQLQKLPFLTEDITILPGRTARFYTCFEYVPGAQDDQEVNNTFFKPLREVTLGFYDVPVLRDAAGNVLKKTSYQFTFVVTKE